MLQEEKLQGHCSINAGAHQIQAVRAHCLKKVMFKLITAQNKELTVPAVLGKPMESTRPCIGLDFRESQAHSTN